METKAIEAPLLADTVPQQAPALPSEQLWLRLASTRHWTAPLTQQQQEHLPLVIRTAERFLTPATPTDFFEHLGPLLVLIAPTGMTQEARTEWLKVAADTLNGIPVDLLAKSCAAARFEIDHPAKVLRFIGGQVKEEWDARIAHLARLRALEAGPAAAPAPETLIEDNSPIEMTPEEIAAMPAPLRKMALGQGWLTQDMIDAADRLHDREEQSDAA